MKEDIQFLKDLQQELLNQDHDCQAEPRYWTVGDYKMVDCQDVAKMNITFICQRESITVK